jgi:dTDP-4-amino-4,6-dideoxygalactose transaminase
MKKFNSVDTKEIYAASTTIMQAYDGHSPLSGYIGGKPFGGPMVLVLEAMWRETFGTKNAVAVNSATSGLLAACMAIDLAPGDEVIVSPYTMSATAAAPKLLGANIVFADIEEDGFCIDPLEVKKLINFKTKSVIATNLFGHPARLHELYDLCDSLGIYLIEDNAQAVFAKEHNRYTGTIGHIGVFSLNVHKQLQVGEGGVVVTDSTVLANNLRGAMNHGEMRGSVYPGLNLRMTEVTAAMACEQLRKGQSRIETIVSFADGITHYVNELQLPIIPPQDREGCESSYYCWAGRIQGDIRVDPPFRRGYMRPLYELPAFHQSIKLPRVEATDNELLLLELCDLSSGTDLEVLVNRLVKVK